MRLWMVDPVALCRQHLLGEHREVHAFAAAINRKRSVEGYLKNGLLEIKQLKKRHEQLKKEMLKRGYKHMSPLPTIVKVPGFQGKIDRKASELILRMKCSNCRIGFAHLNRIKLRRKQDEKSKFF